MVVSIGLNRDLFVQIRPKNMEIISPCEFLQWDTDFFCHKIARVVGHRLDPHRIKDILKWCRAQEIECLYFLADSNHPLTVRLAEDYGFRQVDIRVTLQCDIKSRRVRYENNRAKASNIRTALSRDIPILQAIARNSHTDTRFYSDPCFSRESCEELYGTWIKRSCEGYADVVLVAEMDGQPIGYVSCNLPTNSSYGQIGLLGVESEARGLGVGWALVEQSLRWFTEHNVDEVRVVTQGRNIPSQRVYQRCGFLTHTVNLWYHKWMLCLVEERS